MAQPDQRVNVDEWTRDISAGRTECGRSRSPGACQYGRNLNEELDRIEAIAEIRRGRRPPADEVITTPRGELINV